MRMTLSVLRCLCIFWWMAKNEPCHISKCQSQQKNKQIAHSSHIHQATFHSLPKKDGQSRLSAANLCLLCPLPCGSDNYYHGRMCVKRYLWYFFSSSHPQYKWYSFGYWLYLCWRARSLYIPLYMVHTYHCILCIIMWNKLSVCVFARMNVWLC